MIPSFLIIPTHSNSWNNCHFLYLRIFCTDNFFCSGEHFFTKSLVLSRVVTSVPNRNLISENMKFTNNCRVLKRVNEVFFSRENLRWNPQATESKKRPILRINHLKEILMPSTCFIKILIQNGIIRIISFCADLTSWDIMPSKSKFSHMKFRYLTKIGCLRSSENLMCRNITIHPIESHIFWNECLKFRHKWNEFFIIIRLKFSFFPNFCKFTIWCHNKRINLELVRAKITICEDFLHRFIISLRRRSNKPRHYMCHNFESSIFEKTSCLDRFFVSMSAFIDFVNLVICRLVSDFYARNSISTQANYFLRIYPVWTRLDRHSNHSTLCSFIAFFSFFKCFRKLIIPWKFLWKEFFDFIWVHRICTLMEKIFFHLIKKCMPIINIFDKIFLILTRIYTPSPSNNSHITLRNCIPRKRKWRKSILNLKKRIKFIHFRTLNRRLIRNITFWEIIVGRAINTFTRTTPEFRQKRNHRNPRKRTYSTLAKHLSDSQFIRHFPFIYKLLITIQEHNMCWTITYLKFRKNLIFHFVERFLLIYVGTFYKFMENGIFNYIIHKANNKEKKVFRKFPYKFFWHSSSFSYNDSA